VNLRILKKLSARAALYLVPLGDRRQQFLSEKDDNYHGLLIRDRTCWDRSRCHSSYTGHGDEIVFDTRSGHRVVMRPPSHPLKGTAMIGGMSGYYEPEWEEDAAWSVLDGMVRDHFCYWDENGPTPTRKIRNPSDVFRCADEMLGTSYAKDVAA